MWGDPRVSRVGSSEATRFQHLTQGTASSMTLSFKASGDGAPPTSSVPSKILDLLPQSQACSYEKPSHLEPSLDQAKYPKLLQPFLTTLASRESLERGHKPLSCGQNKKNPTGSPEPQPQSPGFCGFPWVSMNTAGFPTSVLGSRSTRLTHPSPQAGQPQAISL